ncbi:RraA family protein [Pseudonocardia acaciae]|uniref:RraA family protein n=1 Tax=Pseudonocardia acaciae TaxID=551276 RepID=UPI00048F49B3|nr:hypothetical protein [Pseudonocardia acaciae]
MTDAAPDRLSRLDTCVLSDALDVHGIDGVLAGPSPVAGARPFVGRALTVDLAPATPAGGGGRHLGTAAVDAAGPDHVIVVAHHGETAVAGWGGVLSQGAARRGVAAVVVDGAVRDADEIRELGLAVYATAVTPRSARGRVVERAWNRPVALGSVTVAPGDYLRGDGSGIVVIPAARLDQVLATAEDLHARERDMTAAVRAGAPLGQVMGAAYERALDPEGSPA